MFNLLTTTFPYGEDYESDYHSRDFEILVNRVFRNQSNPREFLIEAIIFDIFNLSDENEKKFKENFESYMKIAYNRHIKDENISLIVMSLKENLEKNETLIWITLTTVEILEDITDNYTHFDYIFDLFDGEDFKMRLNTQEQNFEAKLKYETTGKYDYSNYDPAFTTTQYYEETTVVPEHFKITGIIEGLIKENYHKPFLIFFRFKF